MEYARKVKDICKGCQMIKKIDGCVYRAREVEHLCPCVTCLVKPMCSDTCQERRFTHLPNDDTV
jgi:hypothetical protein